jgi:WD40 repeat protein
MSDELSSILAERELDDSVNSIAISADGRMAIAVGCKILLLDGSTLQGSGKAAAYHENSVNSVAFSPDGRRIVSGSSDETIRIWDASTMEQIDSPLTGHEDWVRSVSFSPDGRRIVSGSDDETIRI